MRLAIDENLNNDILRGLLRRRPETDAVRVQDAGLSGADDPTVLEWAARDGRVLVTQDARTMIKYARDRVFAGLPMPGVIEVARGVAVGGAIEDLVVILECGLPGELEGVVVFIPW